MDEGQGLRWLSEGPWGSVDAGARPSPSSQEWTEAKELLQEPAEEEEEEEEKEMPSRDPSPEPPSHRLQRLQDKAGKLSRVREEL